MPRSVANLVLLLTAAIWGATFTAQKGAMDWIGPNSFVAIRFAIAALVLLPFALHEARRAPAPLEGSERGGFALIGVMLFAGMTLQQIGLLTTTATNSGFLTGLYLIFVPLLAIAMYREWPHPVLWPAILLALGGVYLLGGGTFDRLATGDVLTIVSAVFWSLQIVLVGRLVRTSRRPFALSLVQFVVTALLATPLAVAFEALTWDAVVATAPALLFSGIVASGLAFTMQILGQRYTTAPQAAVILSSEALFAALFAALLLGERLAPIMLGGCAMIFLAMLLVEIVPMIRPVAARSRA